ncbi:MAG: hypothetical protein Q8R08_02925 [bacterium]|nr:hypothetical protein [bacterium]
MARLNYQKMIQLLSVILHCPVCTNKYTAEQTQVIESKDLDKLEDASVLVHADCEKCKSSVVFNISLEGPEIFSVGMVTDLTSSDVRKFKESDNLSVDEVIDFHSFLQSFDGDFVKVLR